MSNKKTCCICGKKLEGPGNNPYPLMSFGKECCDDCNSRYVITLRKIYFPEGYSDNYILFNHTPSAKDLKSLVRCMESFFWLDETLENAKRERAAADSNNSGDYNNSINSK